MSAALDAARGYLARGYTPVPVPRGGKRPVLKGWQQLRPTEDDLPALFAGESNIGLILGEPSGGLVDVDLDCDEAIELADEYLPETQAVTGRAGKPRSHRWYVAEGAATRQFRDRDKAMIVELRSTGGQTLVGPSIHPESGETYETLEGEPAVVPAAMLLACVEALATEVRRRRHGVESETATDIEPSIHVATDHTFDSSPDVERRAIAYLAKCPPAIEGQGGHDTTFAVTTALVHGFGLEPKRALDILLREYNPRCDPEWEIHELVHKVESAASTPHSRPFGWLRDSGGPDPLIDLGVDLSGILNQGTTTSDDEKATEQFEFDVITSRELATNDYAVEYLVEGVLVRGQPAIVAGPKKGLKTVTSVDLALALGEAGLFLGRFNVPEAVRVGVMSAESGAATIQETALRIATAKGRPLPDYTGVFWAFDVPQLDNAIHMAALRRFVEGYELDVLILDPTYMMMLGLGQDASNLFVVGSFLRAVIDLIADTGVTPIMCHHLRKGVADPYEPAELEDIAWAGFQEFTRQWILLNRRRRFDPEFGGHHELWLSYGGSAGHSGLWGYDADEGVPDDMGGRRWEVEIMTAREAYERRDEETERVAEDRRERKQMAKHGRDRTTVLRAFESHPDGETKTVLRETAEMSGRRFDPILDELVDEGLVEECRVAKPNGQTYAGFRTTGTPGRSECPGDEITTRTHPDGPGVRVPQNTTRTNPL